MAEHDAQPVTTEHVVDHVHETSHDIVHERDGSPNWAVRLALGIGGVILFLGALAAWQMQERFGGAFAMALPWLVAGGILLGAAAIVESVGAAIWVTLIAGIFVLATAFIVTGRVTVQLDQQAHTAFIVDRFTGEVRVCDMNGCRDLPGFSGPSVKLPSPQKLRQAIIRREK